VLTQRECPCSGPETSPISASQTRTVLSYDPRTTHPLSGKNAAAFKLVACPRNGLEMAAPLCASQTQIVLMLYVCHQAKTPRM